MALHSSLLLQMALYMQSPQLRASIAGLRAGTEGLADLSIWKQPSLPWQQVLCGRMVQRCWWALALVSDQSPLHLEKFSGPMSFALTLDLWPLL